MQKDPGTCSYTYTSPVSLCLFSLSRSSQFIILSYSSFLCSPLSLSLSLPRSISATMYSMSFLLFCCSCVVDANCSWYVFSSSPLVPPLYISTYFLMTLDLWYCLHLHLATLPSIVSCLLTTTNYRVRLSPTHISMYCRFQAQCRRASVRVVCRYVHVCSIAWLRCVRLSSLAE